MGKIVRRKNSKVKWEIWYENNDVVQVMNYSSSGNRSRTIKREIFDKDWEYVSRT